MDQIGPVRQFGEYIYRYVFSFAILGLRNLTKSLQTTPFQNQEEGGGETKQATHAENFNLLIIIIIVFTK